MGPTAFDEFVPLLEKWLKDPPDPYDVPNINRRETVMALLIPFHVRRHDSVCNIVRTDPSRFSVGSSLASDFILAYSLCASQVWMICS